MSKEVFIKMRESEYEEIPNEIKERYFNSKNVTREVNDWELNMQDPIFKSLYDQNKKIKKQLEERQYQLREERRNNQIKQ
jgi:hypothetical protein